MPKIRWLVVYAATTFIMAVTIVTFFKDVGRVERLADALDAKVEEHAELMRKNQELHEKIVFYSSPAGMEYAATDLYNLVRSGDRLFIIELVSGDRLPKQ